MKRRSSILWILAVATALEGCGTGPAVRTGPPVFFPPLPNRPRLQFLTSYTSASDIEEHSSFEQFVVGSVDTKGGLVKPYGAAVVGMRIVVADLGAHELMVIDLENREMRPLKGNVGGGRAKDPINVTAAADGSVYVADGGRNQVLVFGPDESFVAAFGTKDQFRPAAVAVAGDELFVADIAAHEIEVLDRRTGAVLRHFGGPGKDAGQLFYPTNLAVGPDGDLYVTETGNFRVQRFHPDGKSVATYGQLGDVPGTFSRPKGIGVDPQGRLYVADAAFENVQLFDSTGRLLLFFGGPGAEPGNLYLPAGMDVSTRGVEYFQQLADPRLKLDYVVVVVSQYGPRRVNVFGFGDWTGPEVDGPPPPPDAKPETPTPTPTPTTAPAPVPAPAPADAQPSPGGP